MHDYEQITLGNENSKNNLGPAKNTGKRVDFLKVKNGFPDHKN